MERETNRKVRETQGGIKRETKAREEGGKDWKNGVQKWRGEVEGKKRGEEGEQERASKHERLRDTMLENSL